MQPMATKLSDASIADIISWVDSWEYVPAEITVDGNINQGRTAYQPCASCHGADGAAGVQVSGVAATDLARVIPSLSDSTLLSVMQDGSGAMPPQRLDDADAADLVAYLRQAFGG